MADTMMVYTLGEIFTFAQKHVQKRNEEAIVETISVGVCKEEKLPKIIVDYKVRNEEYSSSFRLRGPE